MKLFSSDKAFKNELVSLSVHDEGIALVHVKMRSGKLLLKAMAYEPRSDPLLRASQLKGMIKKLDLEGKPCSLVLHPSQYQLILIDSLNVSADELQEAVKWRVKDMIKAPLDKVAISAFNIPPHGPGKLRTKTFVVVSEVDKLTALASDIKNARLNLKIIDISELALRNLALHYQVAGQTIALLHLKQDSSELVMLREGNVYLTRKIYINLTDFTALPKEEKKSASDAILLEIQRSYDYCDSTLGISIPTQLLVTPQMEAFPEIKTDLANNIVGKMISLTLNDFITTEEEYSWDEEAKSLLALGGSMRLHQELSHATS